MCELHRMRRSAGRRLPSDRIALELRAEQQQLCLRGKPQSVVWIEREHLLHRLQPLRYMLPSLRWPGPSRKP